MPPDCIQLAGLRQHSWTRKLPRQVAIGHSPVSSSPARPLSIRSTRSREKVESTRGRAREAESPQEVERSGGSTRGSRFSSREREVVSPQSNQTTRSREHKRQSEHEAMPKASLLLERKRHFRPNSELLFAQRRSISFDF